MKQSLSRSTLDDHGHGSSRKNKGRQLTEETLDSTSSNVQAVSPKKHQLNVTAVSSVYILALFMLLLTVSNLKNLNGYLDYDIKEDQSSNVVVPSTSAHQHQAQQNEVNEQHATDNRAPDFGIIGYPKTGTTFLLDALNLHPEVVMPVPSRSDNREFCELENWFEDMKNISSPPQSSPKTSTRYGFKCPTMIRASEGIENLVKIAKDKDTRLVMGLRHPVLWFESFYNYRVMNWYRKGFKEKRIPSPFELTGKGTHWRDVSVKHARFDIYMKQLAKVSLTEEEMKEMLNHENMFPKRMSPNPYKIFMLTMEQIADRNDTRRMKFQEDLQKFLKLRSPIQDFASLPIRNSSNSTYSERISICDKKFASIRFQLVKQGKQASKWVINKFMKSPDVIVSNPEFLTSVIREWGNDPCEKKMNAKNSTLSK